MIPSQEILVISLAGAVARRRLMQVQLDVPGMPAYRFIDAVDGSALSAGRLAQLYDEAAAERYVGRPMTPPEIGCAASHLAAYRVLVEQAMPVAIVLEDDALIGRNFLGALDRLRTTVDPERPQMVLLSHVVRYSAWGARRLDRRYRLCKPYEALGGHAYLVTQAGAKAMLAAFPRVCTLGDDWRYFASRVLEVRALIPYVVGTAPISTASQIGSDLCRQVTRAPVARWTRKYLWQKLLFQVLVKPALRLHKVDQTW